MIYPLKSFHYPMEHQNPRRLFCALNYFDPKRTSNYYVRFGVKDGGDGNSHLGEQRDAAQRPYESDSCRQLCVAHV